MSPSTRTARRRPVERLRAPAPRRGDTLRVLVVDELPVLAGMKILLDDWGYESHSTRDPYPAWQLVHRVRPHVALLDLALSTHDEIELARRIRFLPSTRHTLMVAYSGVRDEMLMGEAHRAGFDLHLTKPANSDDLAAILAAAAAALAAGRSLRQAAAELPLERALKFVAAP